MDYIEFKANEENPPLVFSDVEDEITNDEIEDFIDDTDQQREGLSFHRQLDPKFSNKGRNLKEGIYEDDQPFFEKEDTQPELYEPQNRDLVNFNKFSGLEKSVKKFDETFKNFEDSNSENPFFDAVIYGIMFYKSEEKIIDNNNKIKEILGDDFYNDLLKIKDNIKLDRTIFGYFNRCFQVTEVLANCKFSLKFFERRDMYRFVIQKKVQGKNKMARNLSSSVVEMFNRIEMIRQNLTRKEKIEFTPINIICESVYDEKIPVLCFSPIKFIWPIRVVLVDLIKGYNEF